MRRLRALLWGVLVVAWAASASRRFPFSCCSASKSTLEAAIAELQARVAAGRASGVALTGVDGLLASTAVAQADLLAAQRMATETDRISASELAGEACSRTLQAAL